MNIVIVGGTGFIGRNLASLLGDGEHSITILTRTLSQAPTHLHPAILLKEWNPLTWGALEQVFDGKDAVINLAGASVAEGRWTAARKDLLRSSRIDTTRMIVNRLSNIPITHRPKVLINASGIGYYGLNPPRPVDEMTRPGQGFLADLCVEWEAEAFRASDYGVRTVCPRISMVLGPRGGALEKMLLPFQLFLGGPIGKGNQPVSWIHVEDLGRLIKTILEHDSFKGPINAASPYPVTMKEFCRELGKSLGRPSWLPVPAFVLQTALGEMSTLMTHGQHVKTVTTQKLGFTYHYPTLESAFSQIFKERCEDG